MSTGKMGTETNEYRWNGYRDKLVQVKWVQRQMSTGEMGTGKLGTEINEYREDWVQFAGVFFIYSLPWYNLLVA